MLSAAINIFVWTFPNLEISNSLNAGNNLLSIATIQNIIDLLIHSYTSSLPMWSNFIVLLVGSIITFIYFKFLDIV